MRPPAIWSTSSKQHIQYLPVDDARAIANIDTPEDYERLSQSDMISSEKQF